MIFRFNFLIFSVLLIFSSNAAKNSTVSLFSILPELYKAYDTLISGIVDSALLLSTQNKVANANTITKKPGEDIKNSQEKINFHEIIFSKVVRNKNQHLSHNGNEPTWFDIKQKYLSNPKLVRSMPVNYVQEFANKLLSEVTLEERSLSAVNDTKPDNSTSGSNSNQECSGYGYKANEMVPAYKCGGRTVLQQEIQDNPSNYTMCSDCNRTSTTTLSNPTPTPTSGFSSNSTDSSCTSTCCTPIAPTNANVCVCPADRYGTSCEKAINLNCTIFVQPKFDCDENLTFEQAQQCYVLDRNTPQLGLNYQVSCVSDKTQLGPLGNFTYYYNSSDLVLSADPSIYFYLRIVNFYQLWDYNQSVVLGPLSPDELTRQKTLKILGNLTNIIGPYTPGDRMYVESSLFSTGIVGFDRDPNKNIFINLSKVPINVFNPATWSAGIWAAVIISIFILLSLPIGVYYLWKNGYLKKKKD